VIEPTYLEFDPNTDSSTLGERLKDIQQTTREAAKSTKQIELGSKIIALVENSRAHQDAKTWKDYPLLYFEPGADYRTV